MEGNVMNRTEYKNNFYKEHYEFCYKNSAGVKSLKINNRIICPFICFFILADKTDNFSYALI